LPADAPEDGRGDLELEEVWRGAAAAGFDEDAAVDGDRLVCPRCGQHVAVDPDAAPSFQRVTDSAAGGTELTVLTLRCPHCGAALRGQVDAQWSGLPEPGQTEAGAGSDGDDADQEAAAEDPDAPWVKTTVTAAEPLGSDVENFAPAEPGSLADQGPLIDETGADVREYTGEPVETEQGWVLPQQQNVGPGNEAGSGEWPDPDVPSAMPDDDAPGSHDAGREPTSQEPTSQRPAPQRKETG